MKTTLIALGRASVLAALLLGCKAKEDVDSKQPDANPQRKPTIASKQDLERLLTPGMGTNEIALALGEPSRAEEWGRGGHEWRFGLPPFAEQTNAQGTYVSYVIGVAIWITNGHLARWDCDYASVRADRQVRSESLRQASKVETNSPTMEFFLVCSEPIDDGRFIDTERFPKLGFIGRTPTLAVRRLREVNLEERVPLQNQDRTNWSFGIFLTQEDGAKLGAMTATNVSKKVLIMVGNEAVIAPTILGPLGASFAIECQDRFLMQTVKSRLEEMERQGQ